MSAASRIGEGTRRAASIAGAIELCLEAEDLSLPLCGPCEPPEDLDREASALVSIVGTEPVLAAELLREANSPIFNALEPADSIEQAIERVGSDGASNLVADLNARRPGKELDPVLSAALRESRIRSLAISRTAQRVAESTGHSELAGKVKLLGLLCDVGVPFLVRALGPEARERGDAPPLNEFATREIIAELAERCGHRLFVHWNLAPETLSVLQDRAVEAEERQLATLLGLARAIASSIGCAPPRGEDTASWSRALWDHAESLGLSDVAVAALQVHAEDDVSALAEDHSGGEQSSEA